MFSCSFVVVFFFFIFSFFIPRPKGSGDIAMSLVSVHCLSVNIFESAPKLEYFDDTSQLCRTGHDDVSHTKMRALTLILFELSPL